MDVQTRLRRALRFTDLFAKLRLVLQAGSHCSCSVCLAAVSVERKP